MNLKEKFLKYKIITLEGDLGAGKTHFVKDLGEEFGLKREEITSPTFNLLNIYNTSSGEIWHYDLYRLKSAEELVEIGIEEALCNNLVIIEWPELVKNFLPKEKISVKIEILENKQRKIAINIPGQVTHEITN